MTRTQETMARAIPTAVTREVLETVTREVLKTVTREIPTAVTRRSQETVIRGSPRAMKSRQVDAMLTPLRRRVLSKLGVFGTAAGAVGQTKARAATRGPAMTRTQETMARAIPTAVTRGSPRAMKSRQVDAMHTPLRRLVLNKLGVLGTATGMSVGQKTLARVSTEMALRLVWITPGMA